MTLSNLIPLQQYTGERVAPLDSNIDQAASLSSLMANNLGGYFPAARDNVTAGTQGYGQTFTPDMLKTDMWDQGQANKYMNPFIKSVVEQNLAEINRNADIERLRIGDQARSASGFGGSRHALEESELARNTLDQVAKTTNQGYSDAFTQALQAFTSDQNRKLTADTSNQNMGLQAFNANRDQFNNERNRNLQAAQTLGQLATAKSNILSQDVERLLKTGQAKQGYQQSLDDVAYQNFVDQRDYPYTQLQRLASVVNGSPSEGKMTTVEKPNTAAQLAGGAMSLAALIL